MHRSPFHCPIQNRSRRRPAVVAVAIPVVAPIPVAAIPVVAPIPVAAIPVVAAIPAVVAPIPVAAIPVVAPIPVAAIPVVAAIPAVVAPIPAVVAPIPAVVALNPVAPIPAVVAPIPVVVAPIPVAVAPIPAVVAPNPVVAAIPVVVPIPAVSAIPAVAAIPVAVPTSDRRLAISDLDLCPWRGRGNLRRSFGALAHRHRFGGRRPPCFRRLCAPCRRGLGAPIGFVVLSFDRLNRAKRLRQATAHLFARLRSVCRRLALHRPVLRLVCRRLCFPLVGLAFRAHF